MSTNKKKCPVDVKGGGGGGGLAADIMAKFFNIKKNNFKSKHLWNTGL